MITRTKKFLFLTTVIFFCLSGIARTTLADKSTTGTVRYVEVESKNNVQALQIELVGAPTLCTESGALYPTVAYLPLDWPNFESVFHTLMSALLSGRTINVIAAMSSSDSNRCVIKVLRMY